MRRSRFRIVVDVHTEDRCHIEYEVTCRSICNNLVGFVVAHIFQPLARYLITNRCAECIFNRAYESLA